MKNIVYFVVSFLTLNFCFAGAGSLVIVNKSNHDIVCGFFKQFIAPINENVPRLEALYKQSLQRGGETSSSSLEKAENSDFYNLFSLQPGEERECSPTAIYHIISYTFPYSFFGIVNAGHPRTINRELLKIELLEGRKVVITFEGVGDIKLAMKSYEETSKSSSAPPAVGVADVHVPMAGAAQEKSIPYPTI